jgi:hypothetical protein
MSSKFAGLKSVRAASPASSAELPGEQRIGDRPSRQGKKVISGHFSPELSRALNVLAAEQGTTVQALIGEALDLLMRQHDKHPFGER